jgi:hypothetical protein
MPEVVIIANVIINKRSVIEEIKFCGSKCGIFKTDVFSFSKTLNSVQIMSEKFENLETSFWSSFVADTKVHSSGPCIEVGLISCGANIVSCECGS